MSESLGTIRGQLILDVKQALSAYTAVRQQHVSTVTALQTGGAALAQAGTLVAGAGVAMGAGFVTAINAAAEFERKLDYFIAVGGPGAADQYDAVAAKALQLGADTIYSADQIADSFVELAKSGVGAEDIINGIGEGVAALGAAADIPLDTAANIITSAVATFQLGAENAVMVADKLAGAANASIIDVQDLGVSLKYVGGVASSLGVPFEDVNTALAVLGENGIKGSTAGTSLRQVLLGLNGSTKKAQTALKELGIITEDGGNKFYDAEGKAKSLSEVFQILQDATAGMSDQQKTATFQQIFATRALPSLIALTRAGADGFAEMSAEINKTTAYDVASQRLDNLSGDIEILKGNIDTLMITAGGPFQNFARGIVQGITGIIQAFMDLPQAVQSSILVFLAISSVLLIVVGAIGMISGAVLNIIGLAIRMKDAWGAIAGILTKLRVAFFAVFALMRAHPIGLLITAIAALVAGLIWFFTQTEQGQAIWAKLMAAFQSALAVVLPWLQQMIDVVGGALVTAFQAILPVLGQVVDFLGGVFTSVLPIVVQVLQGIITALGPILEAISGALSTAATTFAPVFDQFADSGSRIATAFAPVIQTFVNELLPALIELGTAFGSLVAQIAPLIAQLAGQLIGVLIQLVTTLLPPLMELFSAILPIVSQLAMLFLELGAQLISTLLPPIIQLVQMLLPVLITVFEAIIPVIAEVIAAFLPLITTIMDVLVPAIIVILDIITVVFEAIAPIIQAALDVVVAIITTVTALLKGDWEGVWNGILAILEGVWNLIVSIVQGAINILSSIIGHVLSFISGLWNSVWGGITSYLTDSWNHIVSGVQNGISNVMSFFQGLPGQIMGAISGIGSWLLNAGMDLIRGLGNGIRNMGQWVLDQIGNVINGAIDWAKGLLGINSPSRVFMKFGQYTMEGLANGISNERKTVNRQMGRVVDDMTAFYNQVGAAKELEAQIGMAGAAADTSFGLNRSVLSQLAMLEKRMAEIAAKDTVNIENYEVNNPEPETESDSLPKAIRKTMSVIG